MVETNYGIIKHEEPQLPVISLLRVPHRNGELIVSYPAFGPNSYRNNIKQMQNEYFHSQTLSKITFKEPTTPESISAAAYDFENLAMPQIFNPRWLQAGRILKTPEGVVANPLRDAEGKVIVDSKPIRNLIDNSKKVKVGKGHIYLGENDFGFAEYDSFVQGVQDCDSFTEGGLALILEHTEGIAQILRKIVSPKNYKRGVNIFSFDKVNESIEKVVGLVSYRFLDYYRLFVGDVDWLGGDVGYAFGVLDSGKDFNS
ncbi:MAG: hypothetical protein Q7S74_06725 [Nanoarchaeota archaeon]|nr:hypothetical protein [Nanoarchaeota archaeon]